MKIINLFAGPGTGKSTTAAALFAELKYQGHNTELILEYVKGAVWEGRGPKIFEAQDYIFAKQHFAATRVANEVDFLITDSPILMGSSYITPNYLPSLGKVIREAHDRFNNLNFFIERSKDKPYNPKGRYQTEEQALAKDKEIKELLDKEEIQYSTIIFNRSNVAEIIDVMVKSDWITYIKDL